MLKKSFLLLAVLLTLPGVTLAQQAGDEKTGSSKQHMMQEMIKQEKSGQAGMEGMGGMMGMMKMMEQCSRMMEAGQSDSGDTKENGK